MLGFIISVMALLVQLELYVYMLMALFISALVLLVVYTIKGYI